MTLVLRKTAKAEVVQSSSEFGEGKGLSIIKVSVPGKEGRGKKEDLSAKKKSIEKVRTERLESPREAIVDGELSGGRE